MRLDGNKSVTYAARLLNPTEVLVTGTTELWYWREEQRLPVPGHQFTPRFKRGQWDGTYQPGKYCRRRELSDYWEMRCSRGLLGRLGASVNNGEDLSERINLWVTTHPHFDKLRDYQQEALSLALIHWWGRIALATNAGKGAIIALLAEYATAIKQPVLILCDELAVFDALQGEIAEWTDLKPGLVKSGVKKPPTDMVVVAMVPTLARRLKGKAAAVWRVWVQTRGMVLLDEADKATAPTWKRILSNCKNSHWRVGFSGTFPNPTEEPYTDLLLDELMGPILISAKNIDMIERKVSAAPQVTLYSFDVTPTVISGPKLWWKQTGPERRRWVFDQAITENFDRHCFIASLVQPDTPTTIVVNRIEHGKALARVIEGAVFLDGSASATKRKEVLTQFQQHKIQILIVTKILDRGTNRLGTTADLIFASAEGSNRQTLQRIGRGLRRAEGKEFLRLVDIVDHVDINMHESRWLKKAASLLHKGGQKRVKLYKEEGFDVEIVA